MIDRALAAERRRESQRRWQRANREKHNVHNRVYFAVRRGDLVRPDRCARCGLACKPEASHDDYTRPFDVEWLCHPCHMAKDTKPRGRFIPHIRLDVCRRGHPLVEANTYVAPNGTRRCRICKTAATERHRQQKRNHQ